jgi:hypothetical protein
MWKKYHTEYTRMNLNELIGYMSFTGEGKFVSLGYPWVLPGYEGEVQERLWNQVYGFAVNEHGANTVLQRFRKEWNDQIQFFLDHGLRFQYETPIYILELNEFQQNIDFNPAVEVEYDTDFNITEFVSLLREKIEFNKQAENNLRQYFAGVEFDLIVKVLEENRIICYSGITVRKDNHFSEVLAIAYDYERYEDMTNWLVDAVFPRLKQLRVDNIAYTSSENDPLLKGFLSAGFVKRSSDVYLGKSFD